MNKITSASILSAAVFALGISGPVAAETSQQTGATQAPAGADTSGQSAASDLPDFDILDKDEDGLIDESDVQDAGDSAQVVYRNFDVIDVDRDGQISEQEYSIIKPEATAAGQEKRTDSMGVEPTNEGQTLDETYQP